MSLTLPIVLGKKYVRRNGTTATITRLRGPDDGIFVTEDGSLYKEGYTKNGACWGGAPDPFDLVADFIEPPVGHVHAASMALYAEDAAKTAEPWLLWQYKHGEQWEDFTSRNPDWEKVRAYRRKPVPTTKTVWVNLYRKGPIIEYHGLEYASLEEAEAGAGTRCIGCVQVEVPV